MTATARDIVMILSCRVAVGTESPNRLERRSRGRVLRMIAHYGVLGLVLVAPLLIGGVLPWTQVLLSAAAFLVGLAWWSSRRGDVRWPAFARLAGLATAATVLQLLPLPAFVVRALSSHALELRGD